MKYYIIITNMGIGPFIYKTLKRKEKKKVSSKVSKGDRRHAVITFIMINHHLV